MADYPRLIFLDEDTEEKLISYLETELTNHEAERGTHIADLQRWQKEYWAKPTTEVATFPFTGASTLVIPLNAIAVESIHARAMTTTFAVDQIVACESVSDAWEEAERPLERFLNSELMDHIGIRKSLGDCFLEAEKFGTMIGKVGYVKEVKKAIKTVGGVEQAFYVTTKNHAVIDAVPDSRFLMPYTAQNPEDAPWCGEEHSESPYTVMQMERAGLFYEGTIIGDESKLHGWINRVDIGTDKFKQSQQGLENTKPSYPKEIHWKEIWLGFDVDGDDQEEEIVVHYHQMSRTLLAVRYNWNYKLKRMYSTGVYFPVEHRWRGLGICKMNEQFQIEVTTQHRQRLDNATLANMRMIKIHKMSGYGNKEPVFPGKMWFLDDMSHIETFQMGEIYNSAYNNEQATLIYSQQRTGVNETMLGMPQMGTPGTATGDLARIQEGQKKFDFVFANFKEFTQKLINDTAITIHQFGPRRQRYFEAAANGKLVADFFTMPVEDIADGILIKLKPVSQLRNKIVERQDWQQIAAMLQQYYIGLIQLADRVGDQQMGQIITMKGMLAVTEAMRQILETFDVPNADRIIVREIEGMVRNGLKQSSDQSAGAAGAGGIDQNAAMEYIRQIAGAGSVPRNGATNIVQ